jgi:hypothetical protein
MPKPRSDGEIVCVERRYLLLPFTGQGEWLRLKCFHVPDWARQHCHCLLTAEKRGAVAGKEANRAVTPRKFACNQFRKYSTLQLRGGSIGQRDLRNSSPAIIAIAHPAPHIAHGEADGRYERPTIPLGGPFAFQHRCRNVALRQLKLEVAGYCNPLRPIRKIYPLTVCACTL